MTSANEIMQRVTSLPPLPSTALKLMNVLNDPHSTVDEIVEVIKYDQAVTGEVLRICNSAYFGLSRKVSSLSDALVYLGTAKVLQLVLAVHTNSMLGEEQAGYGLKPGVLWKHSVSVALASSDVAGRLNIPNNSLVFTAGLLHDVGKVVLNEYVAREFAEIVRLVTEKKMTFIDAEQEVLGFSHQEIGAEVGEMWQLPDPIVRCIRYHHDPSRLDPSDPLVDTVYLANCVCLLLGVGVGEDGLCTRADDRVMARHGLGEHDLESVGLNMLTELKRVEQMFAGASRDGAKRAVCE